MKVLYYSELTDKTYETKEELEKAEAKVSEAKKKEDAAKAERAAAAKEVQAKLDAAKVAQKDAQKALVDFCEKYGTFKTSLKRNDIFDPFALLFDPFEF